MYKQHKNFDKHLDWWKKDKAIRERAKNHISFFDVVIKKLSPVDPRQSCFKKDDGTLDRMIHVMTYDAFVRNQKRRFVYFYRESDPKHRYIEEAKGSPMGGPPVFLPIESDIEHMAHVLFVEEMHKDVHVVGKHTFTRDYDEPKHDFTDRKNM